MASQTRAQATDSIAASTQAAVNALAGRSASRIGVMTIGGADLDQTHRLEAEVAQRLCNNATGRKWVRCLSSRELGMGAAERTIARATSKLSEAHVDVFAILFVPSARGPMLVRTLSTSNLSPARVVASSGALAARRDPSQHDSARRSLASSRASVEMLEAFKARGVQIVPVGKQATPFLRVRSEPMTFLLPDGREVYSADVLRFVGEDSLADRRAFAVNAAPWTGFGAILGTFGVMAVGVGLGSAIGFDNGGFDGGMVGALGGLALSSAIALPAAIALSSVPQNVTPSEEEVLEAVRQFNLKQAKPLSVDVVDFPFRYLGE